MVQKGLSTIFIILLLVALYGKFARAQSLRDFRIENYQYVFQAHNKLSGYVLKGPSITQSQFLDLFQTACTVFKKLNGDSGFENAISYFSKMRYDKGINESVESIIGTFSAFVDFISFEEKYLRLNKLTDAAIDQIAADLFLLRARIKEYTIQPKRVFEAIGNAADSTCSYVDKVKNNIQEHKKSKVFWFRVKMWTGMLGGAALALVDGSLVVASGGTVLPVAVLSGVFGSALVSGGVGVLYYDVPDFEP